ncbi:MFS transporter [Pseudactinotalea suaedae]|uniref:MFS transporter n=1 Tax=Pseudactinotalea suaedae TaxID=1524924 RepID=UPI0012E19C58|nr:MFS transporter [Pseudactinotalea suaedae]
MTGSGAPRQSLWRIPQIRAVFAISFAGLASFSITLAALPAWAAQIGHSEQVVGTITGVMLGVTVLTQLGTARLLYRFSTRSLLAAGSLLLGMPTPLYLLLPQLESLYALSAVRGVGFAIVTVVGALAIPRAAPPERRGEAIGIFGLSAAIPMMVGISGGAALVLGGSFRVVAILGALPVLALVALPYVSAEDMGQAPRATVSLPRAASRLLYPAGLLLAITAAGGGLVTLLPLQRPSGAVAALALLVFGAVGMVARWQVGAVLDRAGNRLVLPVLVAAGVLGLVVVALTLAATASWLLMVGAGLLGLAYGGLQTVTLEMSFHRLPASDAPTASAIWNAAFDGGTAVGAAVLGFVGATALGGSGALAIGAAAIAVIGVLGLVASGRSAQHTGPEVERTHR